MYKRRAPTPNACCRCQELLCTIKPPCLISPRMVSMCLDKATRRVHLGTRPEESGAGALWPQISGAALSLSAAHSHFAYSFDANTKEPDTTATQKTKLKNKLAFYLSGQHARGQPCPQRFPVPHQASRRHGRGSGYLASGQAMSCALFLDYGGPPPL